MFFIYGPRIDEFLAGCWGCAKGFMYGRRSEADKCNSCGATKADFSDDRYLNRDKTKLVITGFYLDDSSWSSCTALQLSRDLKYFSKIYASVILYTSLQMPTLERELAGYSHAEDHHQGRSLTRLEDYFEAVVFKPNLGRVVELIRQKA